MSRDPSVADYVATVRRIAPLTRPDELALARAWRESGDRAAAERLVEAHLRYVVSTAFKYRRYGVPVSDLIAEGNFGIVHALKKFDPERGFRFVTYAAHWIRAYILNHVIRSWSIVGGGSGALRSKLFFKLRRERAKLASQIGSSDEMDELLAQKLEMPVERVQRMMRQLEARDVSLDLPVYDDQSTRLVDTLPSNSRSQEDIVAESQSRDRLGVAVAAALERLDERERYIIQSRVMAEPEDELSLAELGRRLGVSRERARQLEARAKGKLQTWLASLSPLSHDGVLTGQPVGC